MMARGGVAVGLGTGGGEAWSVSARAGVVPGSRFPTGWEIWLAWDCAPDRAEVTTSRRGTAVAGAISAATTFASCLETWKKRGSTSARFSGVMAFESA
jgi:hypothetical protein